LRGKQRVTKVFLPFLMLAKLSDHLFQVALLAGVSSVVGGCLIVGAAGAGYLTAFEAAKLFFSFYKWLLIALPITGLLTVWLYPRNVPLWIAILTLLSLVVGAAGAGSLHLL